MNKTTAYNQARQIIGKADERALNQMDSLELKKLEPFIDKDKMGLIWEAYYAASDEFDL